MKLQNHVFISFSCQEAEGVETGSFYITGYLRTPRWPGTHCDPTVSASRALALKACVAETFRLLILTESILVFWSLRQSNAVLSAFHVCCYENLNSLTYTVPLLLSGMCLCVCTSSLPRGHAAQQTNPSGLSPTHWGDAAAPLGSLDMPLASHTKVIGGWHNLEIWASYRLDPAGGWICSFAPSFHP